MEERVAALEQRLRVIEGRLAALDAIIGLGRWVTPIIVGITVALIGRLA